MTRSQPMTMVDMTAKAQDVSGLLKLLANPNRLLIICRLLDGEVSVGDIEVELDIKQPTLSRELGRLRDDGIITARRESKVVFYSLNHTDMENIIRAICAACLDDTYVKPKNLKIAQTVTGFLARPKFANTPQHRTGECSQSSPVKPAATQS